MKKKSATLLLALGIGGAACAWAAFKQIESHSADISCGLGLPPDAPRFVEAQQRKALDAKQKGYEAVCEADLERYRIAFEPASPAIARLALQPVDLSGTPFADMKPLGAMLEPDNRSHSRVYRGFRTPEGHTVTLFEFDMSVEGASSWRAPEDEPERINGFPASLSVFQAPSGNAISHLSWNEERRSFELWIDANVANTPLRDRLFALAESLPRSIPGCPNEIPPKPPRLGAHGFPEFEPAPATLSMAEAEALRGKPACK